MPAGELTVPTVLSAATEALTRPAAGYSLVRDEHTRRWPTEAARVFEDPFSVVAVVVFETWGALVAGWQEAQTTLVELISEHVASVEAKAWDGYLVLLTPSSHGGDQEAIDAIRYDMSRARKLVAAAPELQTISDVDRVLLPLLPLVADGEIEPPRSAMDLLEETLVAQGINDRLVRGLLEAFAEQRPLLERVHQLRGGE
jgi:hypothetical protein